MRKRFDRNHVIDRPLKVTDTLLEILKLFDPSDMYDILPRNWAQAFFDLHPEYFRHYIGELTCKRTSSPHSLLARMTVDGESNHNEMMKYYRSDAGDRFMAERGFPKMPYHRAKAADLHQLFGSLTRASLDLGARRAGLRIDTPRQIFGHRLMGTVDLKAPFTFVLASGQRYTPDDDPLVLRHADESKLLLSEDDRDTEGTATGKGTRLEDKINKIIEVWKRKLYQDKYGHKAALLLFKTTSERHARNLRDHIVKRHGPLPWFLIKAFPEFGKLGRTIPVTTRAFDEPWMRPGCPDFSLKDFKDHPPITAKETAQRHPSQNPRTNIGQVQTETDERAPYGATIWERTARRSG